MRLRIALMLAAAASLASAAAPNQADIAYIQNNVREIAPDSSGSLIVFGEQAFPVLAARSDWGATEPLIAAARFGKGRMVVMGTNAILEQDLLQAADTGRLLANVLRWAAGEKTAPKVGIYRVGGLTARLKGLVEARDIDLGDRHQVDVLVVLARLIQPKDVATLEEYVRSGGGVVTAALGSYLEQSSGGLDLATEVPASRLTGNAGIVWGRGSVSAGTPRFHVAPPPELCHAGRALAAFEENESKKRFLSYAEQPQVYATLFRAIWDLPHNDESLLPRLDRALAPFQKTAVPTAAAPIARDDYPWRLAITRATQRLRWTEPENVRAHPASADFPGAVPAAAPRVTSTVRIEASRGRYGKFGTGLYAAPGEVITVRAPQNLAGQGLAVAIGIHSDLLWHNEEWSRMPNITMRRPILSAETRAASAFGGPIYIEVPYGGAVDFDVTISGGVPAPRYIDGKTSLTDWRSSLRNLPAPWAEIESEKIILSVPSHLVRDLDDPAALMAVWSQLIDFVSEFAAAPKERPRAERLAPDVQISGGIQHNGYPIMMHLPKAPIILSRDELLKGRAAHGLHNRGGYGMAHELGHQVQNPLWNFDGAGESTAQLFSVYVQDKLCHIPVELNSNGSPEFRAQQMAAYFANPTFERWKGEQYYGLTFFLQLQQAFGWEAFPRVFAQFASMPQNERPKNDLEKRDQFMVRFSRQVGRNLGPFFEKWRIPTSEAARASVADLPSWMPEELASR
jgi:hypothetical protein